MQDDRSDLNYATQLSRQSRVNVRGVLSITLLAVLLLIASFAWRESHRRTILVEFAYGRFSSAIQILHGTLYAYLERNREDDHLHFTWSYSRKLADPSDNMFWERSDSFLGWKCGNQYKTTFVGIPMYAPILACVVMAVYVLKRRRFFNRKKRGKESGG